MNSDIMIKIKHLNHLLVFLLSGVVLLSCSSHDHSSSIDLTKNHSVSVFDIFSDVKAIKLETSENNLINDISRVEYYDSRYYILDERSQQIFCFDEHGQFIFKINSQGRGKGEYHYITDFAIDKNNNQMVLLDPVFQRVHYFNLEGKFLSSHNIKNEKVLGLNRVYPMPDSILLLISLTYENLLFYSLEEQKTVYADYAYDVPSTLHAFAPIDNVYFFDNQIFFLPPLSREIVDVTAMHPVPYFEWCFGKDNNTEQEINQLLREIPEMEQKQEYFIRAFQAVGKDKILKHSILKASESEKYRIAVVEYDNDFVFVFWDKKKNTTKVFRSFIEGTRLPFRFMQSDMAIAPYQPPLSPREIEYYEREGVIDFYQQRNHLFYSSKVLSGECQKIIESHDPMTDNPFLVVYKFRE